MAQFTTTNLAGVNLPPSSVGDNNFTVESGSFIVFTAADYTTDTTPPYNDPEGDAPYKIKILSVPTKGTLEYNTIGLSVGDKLYISNFVDGTFIYNTSSTDLTDHNDSFTFAISDIGSEQFLGTGTMTITVSEVQNLPPNQVGDGSATINYGETKVFTVADFTTNTTPPYSDPEGDAASRLKILELQDKGVLYFNGIPVVLNQIISFADIASGSLTQVGDFNDSTNYDMSFKFAIADAGSEIFVE